jgi:leucyl/phenylalanyl-tRNA--protein transferase
MAMIFDIVHDNSDGSMRHPLVSNSEGLVCGANMLNIDALLLGYRWGLFPWYNYGEMGMFYFPHYRYVIKPTEIKIPKSIRPYFTQKRFTVSVDTCFEEVIISCMLAKRKENSTWIKPIYVEAYTALHKKGYGHSIEVWEKDELIGGLYGVAVGKIFTGESMFSNVSNASRYAMIYLAIILEDMGFEYIDCQLKNPYLESFGGKEISGKDFYQIMKKNLCHEDVLSDRFLQYNSISLDLTRLSF